MSGPRFVSVDEAARRLAELGDEFAVEGNRIAVLVPAKKIVTLTLHF